MDTHSNCATSRQVSVPSRVIDGLIRLRLLVIGRKYVLTSFPHRPKPWSRLLAPASLLLVPVIAGADLKVVSEVVVEDPSRPQLATPKTITTFYKGSLVRTEAGKSAMIYDSNSGKLLVLDVERKEYTEQTATAVPAAAAALAAQVRVTSTASIEPTQEIVKIAAYDARKYVGTATIDLTWGQGAEEKTRSIRLSVDQWATEGLEEKGSNSAVAHPLFSIVSQIARIGGTDKLSEELAKIAGVPLSSVVRVTVVDAKTSTDLRPPVVARSTVSSISNGTLPPELFVVPEGFKKAAPAAPGRANLPTVPEKPKSPANP